MKTIKIYRASTQNSDSGAAKGTSSNPYTKEEFESMLEAGTWRGGCVEGMGYVIPRVDIMGSSNSFYDSDTDSWSDPWGFISDPWGSSEGNSSSQPSGGGGSEDIHRENPGGSNKQESGKANNPYPQLCKTLSGEATLYQLVENIGIKATFLYQCGIRISGYTMHLSINVQPLGNTDRDFWATAIVKSNGSNEMYYKLLYNEQGYIYDPKWIVIGDTSFELPQSGKVTVDVCIGFNYNSGVGQTSKSTKIHIYPF